MARQNYCASCGVPIPDGQKFCSMCYGDVSYGTDGYYIEWLIDQLGITKQREEEDKDGEN